MSTAEQRAYWREQKRVERLADPEKVRERERRVRESRPRRNAFKNAKGVARQRGIEFNFTFDEWVEWWGEDFDKRGTRSDSLCMCRRGDTGPYSPENCVKLARRVNIKHARKREMIARRRQ